MSVESVVPLLNVEDVARSIDFYRDALGFQVESSFEDAGRVAWARVRCADAELMLNAHGELSRERRAREGYRDVVLYLSVDSAEELHARLVGKGLAPGEIRDEAYGVREFALRDPDGYELAITSPLPSRQRGPRRSA